MSIVDERIVKMVFDNADFASKVASTITSLTQLNKATDQVANNSSGLAAMGKAFEQAEVMATRAGFHVQDVWQKVSNILEYQVAGKIVDVGKKIANALTFEGITDGLREYETQLESVQTIMANTGLEGSEGLAKVNATLDELNEYADKTIYNFTQMTRNIGTFTAAGLDLDTSAKAIQGIANLAAVSGSTSQQASTAMYQLSQALASGTVKLQDWNSVVNAGMGGKVFQNALIQTAATMSGMGDKVEEWKQKNIDAYGSFRESLTQGAWLTTDVLSQTLNQFTMAAEKNSEEWKKFKKELMDMGYTEQAAEDILKMANTATEAATKVKTFTQLIDTLKEAIGSGWAQTWRILIGDFEEAKTLWTSVSDVLGDFINKSSDARNDMLKNWKALGGRQYVIDSLSNSFKFLSDILKPIGEAMREVFPPITAKNLLYITSNLKKFTDQLSANTAITTRVKSIAKGFFSIFDIGLKLVKAFVSAVLPAGKGLSDLGWNLFDAAAKFGDFITGIDKAITEGKTFEKVFQGIGNVIKPIFDFIMSGAKGATKLLGDFFGSFKISSSPMKETGNILKKVFDDISGGIDNIKKKFSAMSPLFEGLLSLFKGLGNVIGQAFKQIGDSLNGFATEGNGAGLFNIFNAILSGGILYKLFSGVKTFSSLGDSISGVLDGLGDALNSFGEKVGSETLLNTAKAVGILALSLVAVAMVDSNKLQGATAAISAMVITLAGAIAIIMKAVNSFSPTDVKKSFSIFGKELFGSNTTKILEMAVILQSVSKALIAMGAAVLMMAVGLKVVSSAAENGHLWDSFAVVSLILAELTGVALILGKWGGDTKNATKGLLSMSVSLVIMAKALQMISEVASVGNAWESLAILGLMVAGLTGVMIALDKFTQFKPTSMLSLISMAISVNLLVIALKSVSDALGQEGQHIWQALGIIGLMVAGLAGVCVVLSKFAGFSALGGAGAILAATSLLIMVQALKQVSDALGKTDQHIWQALGVIAASLLVLAVGLTAMAGTIPGAAGLLIASAGLIVLGGALKIIGSLKLSEIGKGLLAIAGTLVILALGLTAMIIALPGALALTVAAFGLTVLAGALKLFGSMKLGEIVKSLGLLVTALVGITVISTVLSVASPFILAFSGAILVFGAALIATGTGLTLFAAGLQGLVAVLPLGITALNLFATTLINLLPVIAEKLMDAIGILAEKIVEYGPVITKAVIAIIDAILTAIVESSVRFGEANLQLILGILQVLTENIPLIAAAGTDMMVAFLEAISTEIPRIVDEAYKCAIALIDGLATAIEENNTSLIDAVDHLMTAVIDAITEWIVEFTPLGVLIPKNIGEGITEGESDVTDATGELGDKAAAKLEEKSPDFKQAAEFLIGGFIEGIKGSAAGRAISAVAELGGQIVNAFNSKKGLDEHSNSKKTIKSGEYFIGGFKEGTENGKEELYDYIGEYGEGIVGEFIGPMKDGAGEATEAFSGLTDEVKENVKSLDELAASTKGNVDVMKDLGTETSRTEKAVQKHTESTKINVQAMKDSHDKALALHEIQQRATHEKANSSKVVKDNTEETKKNTEAVEANAKATSGAGKATKNHTDLMTEASGVIEAFTKNYGHLYETLSEEEKVTVATDAVRKLAEETYKASLAAEDATDKNKETAASMEDIVKHFTDMKKKIFDSVKSYFEGDNFFQKFEMKTEMSMQTLLQNMKSNVDGITNWTTKLAELGEKGLNEGLLQQLAELGPKGYEYVNAFSNATAEEIEQANQLFAQAGQLPEESSNTVLASYAQAGTHAVAGFVNALNEGTETAYESGASVGLSSATGLEEALEEQSPSRRTYRDGRFLILGFVEGVIQNAFEAENAVRTLCEHINMILDENLSYDRFYGMGENIAQGLAAGIRSGIPDVESAAEDLSAAAAGATEDFNGISSPAKRYIQYGSYVAQGFANGLVDGSSYVQNGALTLSDTIRGVLNKVAEIAEDDMTIQPVISPVLDLSDLRKNASTIGALFPGRSIAMASSIGIGSSASSSTSTSNSSKQGYGTSQISFTQNNYSPKSLSRYEIYRQTRNQLSQLKGALG